MSALVKLNNPLMGTETFKTYEKYLKFFADEVKLNNPLMGTETGVNYDWYRLLIPCKVKLNNPLMGTETSAYNLTINPSLVCALN